MSKNAVALIDCNNRENLLQFLIEQIDSKAAKNEMVSPYDDQLIGKMNFRHSGMEHSMFFTFARANEYPKMSFRGYKVIYVSLDVSESSSQVLTEMCQYFGGYINHNDDLDIGFERVERTRPISEEEAAEEKQVRQEQIEKERQMKELQAREAKEAKENKEIKDNKDNKDNKENKEAKEIKEVRENKENREPKLAKEKKHERNERREKVERTEKSENQHKNEQRTEKQDKGQRSEKTEHKSRNFHKGRYNKPNKGNQQHKQQNPTEAQAGEVK